MEKAHTEARVLSRFSSSGFFLSFFLFLLKHLLGSVRKKGCSIVPAPDASLVTQNLVGYNYSWGVCLCWRHLLLMALWLRLHVVLCHGIKPSTRGETLQFSKHPRVNPPLQCFTVLHGSLCFMGPCVEQCPTASSVFALSKRSPFSQGISVFQTVN